MASFEKKIQALALRRKGESVVAIARMLGVAKSTASLWCRDVVLTEKQRQRLQAGSIKGGHRGRMRGAETNRRKKLEVMERARNSARVQLVHMTRENLLYTAIALYWAEGTKTGGSFIFVNSDPAMVMIMCRFLKECMGVEKESLALTIQINHVHQGRMEQILHFWSDALSVPKSQFTNPSYIKVLPKKVYENHNSYYGIVRLRVVRSSGLQYQMLGYIEALKRL